MALIQAAFWKLKNASVAELADALDLGSSAFRRAGSIPVTRTKKAKPYLIVGYGFFML